MANIIDNTLTFPYGIIRGQDINTSDNVWQLERLANDFTPKHNEHREAARARLKELDYESYTFDYLYYGNNPREDGKDCFVNAKKLNKEKEISELREINIKRAVKTGNFTVIPTKNLSYDHFHNAWKLVTEEYGDIIFRGIKVREMYYDNYRYGYPIEKGNTSSSKIKNKLIRLTVENLHITEDGKKFLICNDFHVFNKKELNFMKKLDILSQF